MIEPLVAGQSLHGYVIEAELGAGGFARVYRARSSAGRLVALKVPLRLDLAPALAGEADALRRLAGKGFVDLIAARLDLEPPHLVLEHCPGGSLREKLAAAPGARLLHGDVRRLAATLLHALVLAHHAGLVHGDVKPENVLFTADGQPRIADLGLARPLTTSGVAASLASDAGRGGGTLDYLAPELRRGAAPSPRSDVFALGVVLYELLVGERPAGVFELPGALGLAPPDFDAVLVRALASDPERRYADAAAFLEDFAREEAALTFGGPWGWISLLAAMVGAGVLGSIAASHGSALALLGALTGGFAGGFVGRLLELATARRSPRAAFVAPARRAGPRLDRASLEAAAERGDAEALVALAGACLDGRAGAPDEARARRLLERAAATGNGTAWLRLGELDDVADDPPDSERARRALEAYRRAATAHPPEPEAIYRLGVHLSEGRGGPADPAGAEDALRQAADLDDRRALLPLALLVARAPDATRQAEATALFERAAEGGDPWAMYAYARRLERGEGVAADLKTALRWYREASESGVEEAAARLNEMPRSQG